MSFNYCGKIYKWKKNAGYRGFFTCECSRCKRFVKGFVKKGLLIEVKVKEGGLK